MNLRGLPEMQIMSMVFLVAFAACSVSNTISGSWKKSLRAPVSTLVFLLFGVILQQIIYVCAVSNAPPAEVDVIVYIWPIVSILLSFIAFRTKFTMLQLVSVFLGIGAVALVMKGKVGFGNASIGHYLALLSAILWGIYSVMASKLPKMDCSQFTFIFLVGFIIAFAYHTYFEKFVWPDVTQCCMIVYIGVLPNLAAYLLWTNAMQSKTASSLLIIAYSKPIASVTLLCIFGYVEASWALAAATIMVFVSGVLSASDNLKLRWGSITFQNLPFMNYK